MAVSSDSLKNMTISEKQKMLARELYRSTDPELQAEMAEAQQHLRRLNALLGRGHAMEEPQKQTPLLTRLR
jgi:hypothetical protein